MKYVLGVFGFIVLAILAVVLISTTTSNRTSSQQTGKPQLNVADYANRTATFTETIQGRIVGEDNFRAVRISVTPSERRIQILKGYNETVEKEQVYTNTQAGYDVFVHALSNAGFSLERDSKNEELRGSCPLGRRFIFKLNENGNDALNLWTSTCGKSEGTAGGDRPLIDRLFQAQIPDYSIFLRGVTL